MRDTDIEARACPKCGIDNFGEMTCQVCGHVFEEPFLPIARTKARRRLPINLILIVAITAAAIFLYRYQQQPEPLMILDRSKILWETDYNKGIALAKVKNRPVMLFFTADWCGYCKKLQKDAFSDDLVLEAVEHVIPIYVDIDVNPGLSRDYAVRGVPTVIFLDSQGKKTEAYSGARDASVYIDAIGRLIQQ